MKLIGFDYDGTLNWPKSKVSRKNVRLIKKIKKNGDVSAIVSGRSLLSLRYEMEKYKFSCDYYVGDNGAIVVDHDFNIIEKHTIKIETVKKVINHLESVDYNMYSLDDGIVAASTDFKYPNKYEGYPRYTINQFLEIGDIVGIKVQFNTQEDSVKFAKEINAEFKEIVAYANVKYVDISVWDISKATGVQKLIEVTSADEVFVIGDGHNDIPMVEKYGGFALEHANEEIKCVARKVCKDIKEFMENVYE